MRWRRRERGKQNVAIGKLSSARATADFAVLLESFHVGFLSILFAHFNIFEVIMRSRPALRF